MKRLIPLALVLAAIVACNPFRTETFQEETMMPLAEGSADSLYINMSVEYVKQGPGADAIEKMNGTIAALAFDLEAPASSLEEAAYRYRENLIDEYLMENSEAEGSVLSWEDRINGSFTAKYKGWRNYLLSYYSFHGGAHGLQTLTYIVFDETTGVQQHEADFFAPGYIGPITSLLKEAVKESIEAEDPELLELLFLDELTPNDNFRVGADGMQWIFQPYEIGAYALGIVTAGLSWEQLEPYLK